MVARASIPPRTAMPAAGRTGTQNVPLAASRGITLFAAALLALIACMPLAADAVPSAEIFADTAISVDGDGAELVEGGTTGGVRLGLDSAKGDAVRGSVQVTLEDGADPTLDRAYFKARFPWIVEDTSFRFTAGKAPLAWGKGFVFNAGDPVFGAVPEITDFSAGEYRNAADWMAVAYAPLGDFSFAEAIVLPPVADSAHALRSGARISVAPGWALLQSVEASYLYEQDANHRASVALDGSLYFDWYAAASVTLDGAGADGDAGNPSCAVSFGLFRVFDFIPDIPLTFRAEGLVYPGENRQLWYPSLSAGLTDDCALSLQGLIAGDGITAAASVTWTLLKSITLSATAMRQCEKGDPVDGFDGSTVIQAGCTCSF